VGNCVTLIPVGSVPAGLVNWLKKRLESEMGWSILLAEPIRLPPRAYDSLRGQYEGGALLAALAEKTRSDDCPLVGLVDADCFTLGLNFIFGQAMVNGPVCFVALPRLRQSFYGQEHDEELFRERVLKEIVHEAGHTMGLKHCSSPTCVMHFSNRLADTDAKGVTYCQACYDLLGKRA
jgi:archaemetzincin